MSGLDLPTRAIDDAEMTRRAVEIVWILDGISISQAHAVLKHAESLIAHTHYVSTVTPDFIRAEGSLHDPSVV